MSAAPGTAARAAVPLRRPSTSARSATSVRSGASARSGTSARRPVLSLVPARRPRLSVGAVARTPFVTLVVALLAAGLLGLLALNTVLAQDAFRLHTLKLDARELQDREQVLEREVESLQAPEALAARATELGMVPAGPPAFLRLPDGKVLGAETAAGEPLPGATAPDGDPDVPGTPTTAEAATAEELAAQEAQQEAAEDAAAVDAVEDGAAQPAETPADQAPAETPADETAGAGQ